MNRGSQNLSFFANRLFILVEIVLKDVIWVYIGFGLDFLGIFSFFVWMEMMVSLGILSYQQYVRLIGKIFSCNKKL